MNHHPKCQFLKIEGVDCSCREDEGSSPRPVSGRVVDNEGRPVLTSCRNCDHIEVVPDGSESGKPAYVCNKRPHMGNLRAFPF